MSYLARITQKNPTAILLLVDQSGSMAEPARWNGEPVTKAQAVSSAINTLLTELIARSRREGGYQPYYDIAALGYSGSQVRSILPTFEDQYFLTPELLADNPAEIRDLQRLRVLPDGRTVSTVVRQKIWVYPHSEWNTPMVAAFGMAHRLLKEWCGKYKGQPCYPPTVIHITDGEATDGNAAELTRAADKLKALGTIDGNVLLLNVHIGGAGAQPVLFPARADELPQDRYARLLFEISSPMPPLYREEIALTTGRNLREESLPPVRGMAFNANMTDLVRMMNIGTATANLLL